MATDRDIISYLGAGLAANRPATPPVDTSALAMYLAFDTGEIAYWNVDHWQAFGAGTPGPPGSQGNPGPQGVPGSPGMTGARGAAGHDDTLYIPELFDMMAAYWPGQRVPLINLPTIQADVSTVTWDTLADAGTLGSSDAILIGRAGGALVQANPVEFATIFAPYLVDALGLTQAPALGLAVTSITTVSTAATINGKYLDNGFNAGMQYSLDGGNTFLTPAPADMVVTPSGSGGTFAMTVRNLTSQFWRLPIRLVAANQIVTETDFFPVGSTVATIGFLARNPVQGGSITTAYGVIGVASSFIQAQFPALSTRLESVYQGTFLFGLAKWFGNQQIQMPCVPGNYLYRFKNSPETYAGSPYIPWDITVTVTPALIPAIWMEPVPLTTATSGRYSQGPYVWLGQWGFSKPPDIQWRVQGGDFAVTGGTYDTGWIDAHATIGDDGSISAILPMIDTSWVPPLPPNAGYTSIQWRRSDDHSITTVLHAMLP